MSLRVRPATEADWPDIWPILEAVVRPGEVYAVDPAIGEPEGRAYWFSSGHEVFVAEAGGVIVGSYYMRANQGGGGAHVANCGYMTDPARQRRGVARTMCLHSLDHARARGFRAMQFNIVVSTNTRAVRLWDSLGFAVVGRLPGAFHHPRDGYVDALVMFQGL